ncbi:toll/interleukin-1 receptor domain-containing protein [Butyrivibrio sp. AE3009]|uniref:toll/interleukin-1 receptor domain-containing protein n=1 Tax=Butyrivibrio sp. AE3009 TaxID=1280666 RepID=UPI0003B58EF8|nr:toll/interleukin-1 receptor domain-containing protein [Butyrivibrio sp. AE3009]
MKYDAFISYRHLEKDMFVAKGIHKALETTKIPLRIRKEIGRKGIERVFRDQEELPIGASLSDNIESALEQSEFLVVICSPQTKESEWVMKEIDTFIAMHGKQNILAVLVDGEPEDSFPQQLLTDDYGNPREPLAADVRGDSKKEIKKKIKSESLRLAASILYCDYDNLRQRHRERIMRRYLAVTAGVAALGVLFGVYNAYNLARINENYQQKLTNESKILAATSKQVLETGDRKAATLIALEALPGEGGDRPFVPDAMDALADALGSYSVGSTMKKDKILSHDISVSDFAVNSDNTRVVSSDQLDEVYYWNVDTGDLLFKKNSIYYEGQRDKVSGLAINSDAVCAVTEHFMTGYDEAGNVLYENRFTDDYVLFAKYSKGGNYVALNFRESAAVYDARTGELVKTFADEDLLYCSDMIFSPDDRYVGIQADYALPDTSFKMADEDTTNVIVYEIATGKRVDLNLPMDTVLDMFFAPDDTLLVCSTELNSLLASGDHTNVVQKFDYKTGKELWSTDVTRSHIGPDNSYTYVKSRIIDTTEGKKGEVLVSSGRNMYNLDLYTGEINITIPMENDIIGFYLNPDGEVFNVGTSDGHISVMDGSSGYNYADYGIEVGENLTEYKTGPYLITSMHQSPDIVVMSYMEDDTKEVVIDSPTTIYAMATSPEETNFFYTTKKSGSDSPYEIHVVDAATDKEIADFSFSGITSDDIKYHDENTLVVMSYDTDLTLCHIDTGDIETIPDTAEIMDWVLSGDRNVALSVDGKEYKAYDISEKKLLYEGRFSDDFERGYWNDGVLNEKGDTVYYWDFYGRLYKCDFVKKEFTQLFEDYTVLSASFTEDFSKVVLECGDGFARVADTATLEISDEISFFGGTKKNLEFSEDGSKLYLQGSDYYFRIYDLETDEYVYISDDQLDMAFYTKEIPEKNQFIFCNEKELIIIDTDTYGILSRIEYGGLYFTKEDIVIGMNGKTIYKFHVKSLEDLIKDAKEKYGDAKLTPEQRLKYKLS